MRIKILRIITRLNNGGPAKQAIWLSSLLDSEKYNSILISGQTEGNEDSLLNYALKYNVKPIIINELRRSISIKNDISAFIKIYRSICRIKPQIIHTHMSKAGLIGRTAAIVYNIFHSKKIEIVHTFHGHVFHSYFSKIKSCFFIVLERLLARHTDILIAISPKQKNEINEIYRIGKKGQFRVIPLGIQYEPVKRVNANSREQLFIGMMGRISEIKNYNLAIEIAHQLKLAKLPARICVAGGGDKAVLNAYRSSLNDRSLDKYITFIGNVEEPSEFWKNIDIAMITSKNEGTPVALIEAMLTGIPYVATTVGGIPDMVSGKGIKRGNIYYYNNCIQVDSFDHKDFITAIKYYIEDSTKRIDSGKEAYMFAKSIYSINRLIKEIGKLYTELLNE